MRSKFYLLLLALWVSPLMAENQTIFQMPPDEFIERAKGEWGLGLFADLRAEQDLRDRPANRSNESIHEISVGGFYQLDSSLRFELELSVEQLYHNSSSFFAKQAYLDWSVWPKYARVRLGQQFLPLGLINERDNWFSSLPPFYEMLLAESKGIDLGLTVDAYPLGNRWIYAEASVWAGRFVRDIDQRDQTPPGRPMIYSLKSHGEYYDAFVSYFQHHLAYYNAVKAFGAGGELRSPEWRKWQAFLLSEYWQFNQPQDDGPTQRNRALLIYGQIQWWRIALGYRWSQSAGDLQSAVSDDALPIETSQLALLDVRVTPSFNLRVERVMETQSENLRDEWVARALVHWHL